MITLITGGPGTGKTAWTLNEILKLQDQEMRPLYVHGIRDLKIPHAPIYCRSNLCDICTSQVIDDSALYVEDWPQWKEPGALIVIDEVQRIWRPRGASSQPHESVSMLETHRHYGVDFWIISQGPHLFDVFIRALVGRHVHLLANWAGRVQYEWPECRQQLQYRSDAVKRPYKLPKRVYSLYHSAEVHTKQNKRVPLALYGLGGSLALLAFLVYFLLNRFSDPNHLVPGHAAKTAVPPVGTATVAAGPAGTPQASAFPDFTPEKPGVPESAPAYRALVQVKQAPLMAGCVQSETKCLCYTHQATPYPTSQAFCREVVAGHYFNPYIEPHAAPPPVPQVLQSSEQTDTAAPAPSEPAGWRTASAGADDTDLPAHLE